MKIGDGPAAVIGDESCKQDAADHKAGKGAAGRMIRKSEDLPEHIESLLRGHRRACLVI